MEEITVGIAEDHELVRKGFISIVNSFDNIKVVCEACDGQDLVDQFKDGARPNVVLMDLNMPRMDGYQATEWLKVHHPDTKVIALSQEHQEQFVVHMMEIGGKGYLLKNSGPEELEDAIKCVYQRGHYLNEMSSASLMQGMQKRVRVRPIIGESNFSENEKQILLRLCQGKSANEIAEDLSKSPRTIEKAKSMMMEKAGVKKTVGLVVFALKNGIIELFDIKE
ncbi:MAG: response regulator [Flavobacteriales bacterium]